MNATQAALWTLTLITFIAIAALCAMAAWKRPNMRLWTAPPASWALHGMAFFAFVLAEKLSPLGMARWASALWLHACFLVLGGVWLFLWPARRVK